MRGVLPHNTVAHLNWCFSHSRFQAAFGLFSTMSSSIMID